MAENRLQALDRIADLFQKDGLTERRFLQAFKQAVDLIKANDTETKRQLKVLKDTLDTKLSEIEKDNDDAKKLTRQEVQAMLSELQAFMSKKDAEIMKRLLEVRDGMDADEDIVVERATERVKEELFIPTTEDMLNEIPSFSARIRDALELLEGEERLNVSAIKGLKELLEDLNVDGKIKKAVGAIHVPSPVGWTKHQSISLSSGTTVYSLDDAPAHGGKAAIVRYEGQVLTETTHYSISGTDVTLTFDPDDGTTLDVTYWQN